MGIVIPFATCSVLMDNSNEKPLSRRSKELMILEATVDRFFASAPVRSAIEQAVRHLNDERFAEAETLLRRQLAISFAEQPERISHDYTVLYVYLAITVDHVGGPEMAPGVLTEALNRVASIDRSERYYQPRLIEFQLCLLQNAGDMAQVCEIAKRAVERFVGPAGKGEEMSNLHIEDVHLTYGRLLLDQGDKQQGVKVLQRVTDRCTYAIRRYGPAGIPDGLSEEGKFERFYLNQIAEDARKLSSEAAGA